MFKTKTKLVTYMYCIQYRYSKTDSLLLPSLWIPIVSLHRNHLVKVHSQTVPEGTKRVALLHLTLPAWLAVAHTRAISGGPVLRSEIPHEILGLDHTMVFPQWLHFEPFIKLYIFLNRKFFSLRLLCFFSLYLKSSDQLSV